jgi:membrane-associated protein
MQQLIMKAVDVIMHIDKYLGAIIQQYGIWTYALLFTIILCETGLVVTPFLPGDSLLFAAGALAAQGSLNITWLCVILGVAAVLGDTLNYSIGKIAGPKVFRQKSRFFKKEYLDKTHAFYEKYGKKTIVIARFVPIIRTFAPFVAGIGQMNYAQFIAYNVIGGISWVLIFTLGGYFFGSMQFVKDHFSVLLLAIIIISFVPLAYEFAMHKIFKKHKD